MHRIYTSLNFQNEIMKLLPRIDYSVEMLVDEKDLVVISKDLYIFLEKNIQADIIICANTNKKSHLRGVTLGSLKNFPSSFI